LCGSGIEALERFLTDFPPLPEPTRAINLNEHCTSIGLMLTGTFLQVEWATHETLKHLYGGGYEIATLYGDGFRKVDDITYLFWTAELTENPTGVKVVPRRAFRYAYCGDLLRIRSVTLIPTRQGFSGSDTLFAVPPIYRDLTADEDRDVTRPAFDTTWLCNYFLVHSGATIKVITCAIDYRYTDRKRLVNFTEIPNGIALNVHGQFLHREGERILTVLGLHKPS
jgi:hypothetical protein